MASEILKGLRDQRMAVVAKMKAIADVACAENNRSFSGEEEASWVSLNAELDAYDKRIKNMIDGEARAKSTEEAFAKLEGKEEDRGARQDSEGRPAQNGPLIGQRAETTQLRKFLLGQGGRHYDLQSTRSIQQMVERRTGLGVNLGGSATPTAGGDLVPTDFYGRLVEHLIQTSAVLQANPTVLNTSGGEVIQIPKTVSHSTASLVTEGTTITESDPVFGQVSLGAYKYATLISVSRELLTDEGVDLEGYLSRECGTALGNAMGTDFVVGNGTGKPHGVLPNASLGVTGHLTTSPVPAPAVGAFNPDDLIDLYYSVIPQYRNSSSAVWMMSDQTVAAVRKLKDANDRYLWQPSIQIGAPDTLLGKPIVTDYNVPGVATVAKSVLFGDFSRYFVRFAGGARFERSDEFAFGSDMVTFRAIMRADGNLVDQTGAIKYFAGGAT